MAENQLWYNKHRPKSFEQYVWTDDKLKATINEWIGKRSIPSLLLAGGPGRGKTTLADLLIQALDVDESDVLRLKGARDNTADAIRTKVAEFCELGGWSGLRIVFFDEADLLTHMAQLMLRTVIDDYADAVRFILTCNYPHKIIDAISTSRLVRIEIEDLPTEEFMGRLVEVLIAEGISCESDEALGVLAELQTKCYPDLRRAINELQGSVIDGRVRSARKLRSATATWESYIGRLITEAHDPVREIGKIRETLTALTPDEIEDVYRFLYQNGDRLFGDKQIQAIQLINVGQKSHRLALLPDMILLEVILRLMLLVQNE
jgi:replication factor C small subunit